METNTSSGNHCGNGIKAMKDKPKITGADLVQRNGVWKIRFRGDDGRMRFVSTGQRDKNTALRILNEQSIPKILDARRIGLEVTAHLVSQIQFGSNTTICDLSDEYCDYLSASKALNTIKVVRFALGQFIREAFIEKLHPMQVNEKHVSAYINGENNRSRATKKLQLFVIKNFFKWMNAMGYCPNNPALIVRIDHTKIKHHKLEHGKRQPWTDEEISRIHLMKQPYQNMCWFALYTGLRKCDIMSLEWDSIGEGVIVKWTQKNQTRLEIPIVPELAKIIKTIERRDLIVFPPTCHAQQWDMNLWDEIRKIGVTKGFHSLRHTYAVKLLDAGKPVWFIRDALGHGSEVTTERYLSARIERRVATRWGYSRYRQQVSEPHVSNHHSQFV